MKIIPVILSGGAGTRLWPLSKSTRPKQFLSFGSRHSLIQETVLRCRGKLFDERPIIISSDAHRFLVAEAMQEIDVQADIILEPVARNTAPAIASGALMAVDRDPDAVVLALSADHYIPDGERFRHEMELGLSDALDGRLITFGAKPTRPATGYGYILPGQKLAKAFAISEFREKPTEEDAARFIDEGYLWNTGNFMFRASRFIDELSRHEGDMLRCVLSAFEKRQRDFDFIRLDRETFSQCKPDSIDYAVMEKTADAAVLPIRHGWSDIGTWQSIAEMVPSDENGNAAFGDARFIASRNSLVHADFHTTALIGVEDLAVVATRDTLLVLDKSQSEEVKPLVEALAREGNESASTDVQVYRPWGNYECLANGRHHQVKRIVVKPGCELSLQKHKRRAEHWVVVEGRAEVTIGDKVKSVYANESVEIPLGSVHRLANRGHVPVVLIEVQTGDYFGEDDIIRLEDVYNRDERPANVMD